jgi:hypothetical protein
MGTTMARDMDDGTSRRRTFGPVDPFCWFAVIPMFMVAGFVTVGGVPPVGIAVGCLAIGVLVFDSWVNRPRPPSFHRSAWPNTATPPRAGRPGAPMRGTRARPSAGH